MFGYYLTDWLCEILNVVYSIYISLESAEKSLFFNEQIISKISYLTNYSQNQNTIELLYKLLSQIIARIWYFWCYLFIKYRFLCWFQWYLCCNCMLSLILIFHIPSLSNHKKLKLGTKKACFNYCIPTLYLCINHQYFKAQ